MSVKTVIAMFATVAATFAARRSFTQPRRSRPSKPQRPSHQERPCRGQRVNYYYAVYGTGEPLLLLQAAWARSRCSPQLTKLSQSRQVIGVDLQGHGRTPLGDREISLITWGNDMAGVVKKLATTRSTRSAIRGWRRRAPIRRSTSANGSPPGAGLHPVCANGFYPEMLPQQAAVVPDGGADEETPMYKSYMAIAPHPEEFPKLLDAMAHTCANRTMVGGLKKLTMPVILIYGDSDMIRPEHIREFYQLLGGD